MTPFVVPGKAVFPIPPLHDCASPSNIIEYYYSDLHKELI